MEDEQVQRTLQMEEEEEEKEGMHDTLLETSS